MSNKDIAIKTLKKEYGSFFGKSPLFCFDPEGVPEALKPLVPFAMFWGIPDDWIREQLVAAAPDHIKASLKKLIKEYEEELDAWLAGEESLSRNPSDAYVAFSAMRMCVDFM